VDFRLRILCSFLLGSACALSAQKAPPQPAAFFSDQCSACHTIGGGAGAGPDLKGVTERRKRAWLVKFIQNSQSLIAAKDATALALQKEFGGMEMPGFADITTPQAEALLEYIATQWSGAAPAPALTAAPIAEVQVSTDPQIIAMGRQLFLGERRLAGGGAACMSCHTARGVDGLGGGHLGPDLSLVFDRLGKAKGLTAWLSATPTPIMSVTYKKNPLTAEEISALTAFFQNATTDGASSDQHGRLKFLALAGGCTLLGFVVIGGAWRNRLRAVREKLVPWRGEQ
jgi:mono/diheme cytochrome c family protein